MNRLQKQEFVTDFTEKVLQSQAMALMSFSKLTVEQMTSFRLSLRKNNVRVKVVKNTLAERVFGATAYAELGKNLTGPTLVAYGEGDPVLAAKAICEWATKEGFQFKLKNGAALGQVMTDAQITALSKLPGRNELFVSFLWALKSPATKFLYALQDAPQRMGYAIQALKQKKETV